MKRFVIREVETLKTTAAMYACDCCCPDWCDLGGGWGYCCDLDGSVWVGIS
ncbi:MAG TPA: hypothetical protein VGS07_20140 [Thermoanaerobaculia bacterium]|nr:hypothetical protein [Thermoanaerobaculia bacterium]